MWLWVHCNKIPVYPIFYLLSGDFKPFMLEGVGGFGINESIGLGWQPHLHTYRFRWGGSTVGSAGRLIGIAVHFEVAY